MTYFSEKIFLGDGFQFFITVLEDIVKQRSNSPEVFFQMSAYILV